MFRTHLGPSVVSLVPRVAAPVTCHLILDICSMGSMRLGLNVGIFYRDKFIVPLSLFLCAQLNITVNLLLN